MSKPVYKPNQYVVDFLTVISLSMLAYTLAILLNVYAGRAATCAALGGMLAGPGPFDVDCQYGAMPDLAIRFVALSGPLLSFLSGLLGLFILRKLPQQAAQARYLTWLFASISLMMASGFVVFSGFSGQGDFGLARDGVFYNFTPQWAWRVGISLVGVFAYGLALRISLIRVDDVIGGKLQERVYWAQRLAQASYLAGCLSIFLFGLLHPQGLVSAFNSSVTLILGGTSGLVWMMLILDRKKKTKLPALHLVRSWSWIAAGFIGTLLYAVILGLIINP